MKTRTRRRIAGGILAAVLSGGLATAATTSASAEPCGNEWKLTSAHTLYRTASGFTPKGSLPSGDVVFQYGLSGGRMDVGNGWISTVNMVIYRQGTCF